MSDAWLYLLLFVTVVLAVTIVKKVAGCLLKLFVALLFLVVVAVLFLAAH